MTLKRYASMAARVMHDLRDVSGKLWWKRFGSGWIGSASKDDEFPATEEIIQNARSAFLRTKELCKVLPLSSLVPELERAIDEIDSGAVIGDRLQMDLEATIRRLSDELSDQKFLHVEIRDIDIYDSATPFGDVVAARFPFMREDISEAGRCLALGRYTACVFHLMRVMEACVQWLGGRLEIAKLKNKRPTEIYQITWGEIMVEVNKVIEDMARGERRERLADAAAHLGIVRIAWRNTTMHPKRTYTHEEARAIWQSVDLFVRSFVRIE